MFPVPSPARLSSVDVFDTLLVRGVGHPDGVFLLLGRLQAAQRVTDCSPEAFARARKGAQDRAHATHQEAVGMAHILAELAWALGLTPAQVDALRCCEMDLESSLISAVPGAAAWLGRVRGAGRGRLVFTSDTYLPSEYVRRLLSDRGLWQEGDGLYVSCETGREKQTGRMFKVMARREQVALRHVRHYGNDPVADVAAARRSRCRATHVPTANLNRYEELLDRCRVPTGGLSSLFAGASRLARLSVPASDDEGATIRDVTAGVVAPTVVAYVMWVLSDAARAGLRRLYFASRDGEVLLHVARRLVGPLGLAGLLELRYLYGSRQAWSAPALRSLSRADLDWIMADDSFLSVRTALGRLGLEPGSVEAALTDAGLPPASWDDSLTRAGRRRLERSLMGSPVADVVLERAAVARAVLERYLGQEALADPDACGVVDVGWSGRTGGALDSILTGAGADGHRAFYYLGLQRHAPGAPDDRRPWLFDDEAGLGPDLRSVAVAPLVEAFCTGSHGLVLGYADHGDGVTPVLKSAHNVEAAACGLDVLRATVDAFVDHLVLSEPVAERCADLRDAVVSVLVEFATRPTRVEARVWGRFPYGADPREFSLRTLAAPYRAVDAAGVLALGPLRRVPHRAWPAASRRLSPRPVAWAMGRPADLATRARGRLASAVRRVRLR